MSLTALEREHELFRKEAHRRVHAEGSIEVDEDAIVSDARDDGGDDGAYVQAWVWITSKEAGIAR